MMVAQEINEKLPARTSLLTFHSHNNEAIMIIDVDTQHHLIEFNDSARQENSLWFSYTCLYCWDAIIEACLDLLEAGYPGCLGCGGPGSELEWNEKEHRIHLHSLLENGL